VVQYTVLFYWCGPHRVSSHMAKEDSMKASDLYKVIKMGTHTQCHFGDYVVLLRPLGQKYWWALNVNKGTEHHYRVDDLEAV